MTPDTTSPSSNTSLDPAVWRALGHGHTIDLTTIGRRSGEPRRIEIVFFNFGGRLFISGMPNPNRERAWLLNVRANPNVTFHLKQLVSADLPATAHEVTDPDEVREIQTKVARAWRRDPEEMIRSSPLIEIVIPGYGVADPEHPAATVA
ncbi:MAG TPA: nitroreductase family deazaflavin-dependent oxidoreductase [Candidatus Limnocylindrales bacterium]|jgi:deazaflavin-dependent oxidoreductase (nitroreductase family)|nr:nitroreductase family deazaflavin-dependent oxidoreductase [Candidatus Limnocylindrales bacterium]